MEENRKELPASDNFDELERHLIEELSHLEEGENQFIRSCCVITHPDEGSNSGGDDR